MKILKYVKLMWKEEIARRYFVMNSFDGALTILGIITALFIAGINNEEYLDAEIVIISCFGAAVAMGVSGFWGAYSAEIAERTKALKRLERQMLTDLKNTKIGESIQSTSILIAIVDGLSPLLVAMILIIPFLFAELNFIPLLYAFYIAFFLIMIILFSVGVFTGYIAGENKLKSGLRMLSAGIVIGIVIFIIQNLK